MDSTSETIIRATERSDGESVLISEVRTTINHYVGAPFVMPHLVAADG